MPLRFRGRAGSRPPLLLRPRVTAQPVLTAAFYVFLFAYALEGFVRYLLNIAGSDALIFTRDALLYVGLAHLLILQLRTGRIRVFFLVWVLLLLFHGLIGFANLRQLWPVVAGAKAFTLLFFGCLAASLLFDSTRRMSRFIALLWFVSVVGAFFDKYLLDWPSIGMTTNLGGLEVDIGRKWEVGIGNERVAGLSRSSIPPRHYRRHLRRVADVRAPQRSSEARRGGGDRSSAFLVHAERPDLGLRARLDGLLHASKDACAGPQVGRHGGAAC